MNRQAFNGTLKHEGNSISVEMVREVFISSTEVIKTGTFYVLYNLKGVRNN